MWRSRLHEFPVVGIQTPVISRERNQGIPVNGQISSVTPQAAEFRTSSPAAYMHRERDGFLTVEPVGELDWNLVVILPTHDPRPRDVVTLNAVRAGNGMSADDYAGTSARARGYDGGWHCWPLGHCRKILTTSGWATSPSLFLLRAILSTFSGLSPFQDYYAAGIIVNSTWYACGRNHWFTAYRDIRGIPVGAAQISGKGHQSDSAWAKPEYSRRPKYAGGR